MPATAKNLTIITPRTWRIYFLPKIHKPNNPGRLIVSACSCPTEPISTELISSYLDKTMAPIVKTLPSYNQHALEIFRYFNFLSQNKFIFTMNITSLYTVILDDRGVRALKLFFFNQRPVKEPSSETLLRLAELAFTVNCFHSVATTTNKLMALSWVLKWDPATQIFSLVLSHTNFLVNTTASNLNSTAATLTTASALPPVYQSEAHSVYNRRQFLSPSS